MSVLVVGTVGIDTVETPKARRDNVLGGSAVYFAFAASFYTRVQLVGVVGDDFPKRHRELLESRDIDLRGLETAEGKTFRWTGKYHENMIDRDTLNVELNVFGNFDPKLPASYRKSDFVFLANGSPSVQMKVLDGLEKRPKFIAADTMDLWIETTRSDLEKLLHRVDALILNDSEARLMTDEQELLKAGREILKLGPALVIIKKGEHGALAVSESGPFAVPAFPLEEVVDPTGAGDTFAGGIMGYLAEHNDCSRESLRRAVAHGAVVASFTVEGFSLDPLQAVDRKMIDDRYAQLLELVRIG